MTTSVVYYSGDLRTESEHLQSGNKIITDAPIDNEGKGEGFSPTDLVSNLPCKLYVNHHGDCCRSTQG
jgi:hypothetical protein